MYKYLHDNPPKTNGLKCLETVYMDDKAKTSDDTDTDERMRIEVNESSDGATAD
jgi:hypothetical protein